MKYVGLAVAAIAVLAALTTTWRRVSVAAVVSFAVPAVVVSLPWYVKNAVLTGDPLYPFLRGGTNPDGLAATREVLEGFGYGRSLLDALLLPIRLLGGADAFDRGDFISPLFAALAPVAALDRAARPAVRVIGLATIAFLVFWFLTSQQARFLLPLMPPLAVASAVGAVALARSGRVGRVVVIAAVAGSLAVGAGISGLYGSQFLGVVAGTESEREFLGNKSPYFTGVEWLNTHLAHDDRVLLGFLNVLYLEPGYVIWSADELARDAGPEETRAFQRRLGADYAAVLGGNGPRLRQLTYLGARIVARLPVRLVTSRTLNELGPPEMLLVYRLPAVAGTSGDETTASRNTASQNARAPTFPAA
jgi:hypothetical protein